MGGLGSGRGSYSKRATVEQMVRVDVRKLHRQNPFPSERSSVWLLTKDRSERLEFKIVWTGCNYGNKRPWWLCPHCGRRCAILYRSVKRGLQALACRECYNLTYWSCKRNTNWEKACQRLERVERKMGVQRVASMNNWHPDRPKGMHQRTYERLLVEWHEARGNIHDVFIEDARRFLGKRIL